MRKVITTLMCILLLFLTSCGVKSASKKAVDEGKIAIVSEEYEKSRDLFKLAVNEDSKNTEAKRLFELSNNYIALLEILNTKEYEKLNELFENIEGNKELDIIKDNYEETKKIILENREIESKYSEKITAIEKEMNDGNSDKAKSLAVETLQEVKGYKALEDRLNAIINKVDETISSIKAEILKYHSSDTDITYEGIKTFDDNSGVFAEVTQLYGKSMYCFTEESDLSPKEYAYDKSTKDIFLLTQGQVFWLNNGNIHLNATKETSSSNTDEEYIELDGTASQPYMSKEEAVEYAIEKFKVEFPYEPSFKAVGKDLDSGYYEVDFFDGGGQKFFGRIVVDAKNGTCWLN